MEFFSFDSFIKILDILLLSYLIYRGLLLIRGTRAASMLSGLLLIIIIYFIARHLNLVTLDWVLSNFLSSIIIVVIVLFQDEIRRGLTKIGFSSLFVKNKQTFDKGVQDLVWVVSSLRKINHGALIVIQKDVGLDDFIEDGVELDALIKRKLLYSIFLKESPLHDGAVIVEGDRIKAAGCVLPLSFTSDLDPNLGTRHRAALGISERSDAVVIVVSEETSKISLIFDGKLNRNLDEGMLKDLLNTLLETKVKSNKKIGKLK